MTQPPTDLEIAVAFMAIGNAAPSLTGLACYVFGGWRLLIWLGWL